MALLRLKSTRRAQLPSGDILKAYKGYYTQKGGKAVAISQEEWDALPQEEKNRRILEFKRSLRHILEGHGKEVVVAALKSILEDMKDEREVTKR